MNKLRNTKEILEQLEIGWIDHKEKLHKIFTPTQMRIIQRRLFNKRSFESLGIRYARNTTSIKLLFDWSLSRIREKVNKEFAIQIQLYNSILIAQEERLNK